MKNNNSPSVSQRLLVAAVITMIIAIFVGCASKNSTKNISNIEIPSGKYKVLDVRESAHGDGAHIQYVSIVLTNETGTRYVYQIKITYKELELEPVVIVPGDNVIVTENDITLIEEDSNE